MPMPHDATQDGDRDGLARTLRFLGLLRADEVLIAEPLTGGVSSDILRVTARSGPFVVKQALAKLRVAADWRAPVERNLYEVAWLREAGKAVPGCVPAILADDPASGLFAMAFLDPADHPVWKAELMAGKADAAFAAEVGRRLAAIHAATAGRADVRERFATDTIFHAIRLEPYLEATAGKHPAVAARLMDLSRETLARKVALVHGDVSPKNILHGPDGPVFLDAECAWYGDPAFDIAFCANHLLLKCLARPDRSQAFLASFDALAAAYLAGARWEDADGLEARAARLLPALFLARVDGKSPVEYVTGDHQRDLVRGTALPFIAAPPARLSAIREAWAGALASASGNTP
jgi:aminoglycoside phosphotransferase (APT) family kinase protein